MKVLIVKKNNIDVKKLNKLLNSLKKCKIKYDLLEFDDVDSACKYVLSLVSFDSKVTESVVKFYKKMLSVQFNDMEALEYIEYYLDETNIVRERSRK